MALQELVDMNSNCQIALYYDVGLTNMQTMFPVKNPTNRVREMAVLDQVASNGSVVS